MESKRDLGPSYMNIHEEEAEPACVILGQCSSNVYGLYLRCVSSLLRVTRRLLRLQCKEDSFRRLDGERLLKL